MCARTQRDQLAVMTDGTYRLHLGGWSLVDLDSSVSITVVETVEVACGQFDDGHGCEKTSHNHLSPSAVQLQELQGSHRRADAQHGPP